jgi:hypothetical protein
MCIVLLALAGTAFLVFNAGWMDFVWLSMFLSKPKILS